MMVMGATTGVPARYHLILMSVIRGLFCVRRLRQLGLVRRRFVVIGIDLYLRVGVASAQ
jgi:hypothetical protein